MYDQEVIEFWDDFPKTFIKEFISRTPDKRVLNLGSGSGRDALLLREQGMEVYCLDASSAMTKITEALGFETMLSTFADADFAPGAFDAVWAYTSLIHISPEEIQEMLKRIHTWLVPNGVLVIGAIEGTSARMVERSTMPGAQCYFKFFGKQELKDIVTAHGFTFLYEEDYQPHSKIYLNQLYIKA